MKLSFSFVWRCLFAAGMGLGALYGDIETTPAEKASHTASCEMLKAGQYAALDAKMNSVQREYETGRIADVHAMHMFRSFCGADASVELRYTAWIKAFPQSYAAMLSHGVYLRDRATEVRGTKLIRDTPQAQIDAMEVYGEAAMRDLAASIPLTAKPLLTFHAMMGISRLMGGQDNSAAIMSAANRIDPKNFVVRYKYMFTLEERWGGSLEEMLQWRENCRQAGLSREQLVHFDHLIQQEREWQRCCGSASR